MPRRNKRRDKLPSNSKWTSVHQVLHTTELLEMILASVVDFRQDKEIDTFTTDNYWKKKDDWAAAGKEMYQLLTARLVCRRWAALIETSPRINRILFFQKNPGDFGQIRDCNRVVVQGNPIIFGPGKPQMPFKCSRSMSFSHKLVHFLSAMIMDEVLYTYGPLDESHTEAKKYLL
jgi:hypothetical protein